MILAQQSLAQSIRALVRRPFGSRNGSRGMTLIEIIIVIALLGTLMAILIRNITQSQDTAKEDESRIGMGVISQSLQMYRVHNNVYPTTAQGLEALVSDPGGAARWRGPYIEKEKLKDPWQNPYSYNSDGRKFQIISGGLNGMVGDADDIYFPPKEEAAGAAPAPAPAQ